MAKRKPDATNKGKTGSALFKSEVLDMQENGNLPGERGEWVGAMRNLDLLPDAFLPALMRSLRTKWCKNPDEFMRSVNNIKNQIEDMRKRGIGIKDHHIAVFDEAMSLPTSKRVSHAIAARQYMTKIANYANKPKGVHEKVLSDLRAKRSRRGCEGALSHVELNRIYFAHSKIKHEGKTAWSPHVA